MRRWLPSWGRLMADRTLTLQRCATDLFLDPGAAVSFATDPLAFGQARGLGKLDQAALDRFKSRLLTYRNLVRFALEDPLPDCFPILYAHLDEADLWSDCVDAFLASRSIQSSYYRDIHPAFVAWLASSGWGQDERPFLLPLAHFEYIEMEILRWPDKEPEASDEGLDPAPAADLHVVFDGTARNLAYAYRVHQATKEKPEPVVGQTYLLGYRDADGDFMYSELSPHASAFLARCLDGDNIGEAASALNLELEEVLELLAGLREKGAILGFSDATA